jgi:hypothetical protein
MRSLLSLFIFLLLTVNLTAAEESTKIVLIAGKVNPKMKAGQHDYEVGCKVLAKFLEQTPGVKTEVITGGWPQDSSVFKGAKSLVFYCDGNGKQDFLKKPERLKLIKSLVAGGVGLVSLHQTIEYPKKFIPLATAWFGGTYIKGARGHWPTKHEAFPDHEVCRGVTSWSDNDGWLTGINFTAGMKSMTPLVWSGKTHKGASSGGDKDIVSWTYDRVAGGRSFVFSGLHQVQSLKFKGLRKLLTNGILWSAGVKLPQEGSSVNLTEEILKTLP